MFIEKKSVDQLEKPSAFAIIRNAHEAFRACFRQMIQIMDSPIQQRSDFQGIWHSFIRAMNVHLEIEETDFFPLLDEVSHGEVTRQKIYSLHPNDEELLEKVKACLPPMDNRSSTDQQWNEFKTIWNQWHKSHEEHFVIEEKLMTHLTIKVASTPEQRALIVHNRVIIPAKKRSQIDFIAYLIFCIEYLSKFGSILHNPYTSTYLFLRGLKSACYPKEWQELMPTLKQACVEEIWLEMSLEFDIESSTIGVLSPVAPEEQLKLDPSQLRPASLTIMTPERTHPQTHPYLYQKQHHGQYTYHPRPQQRYYDNSGCYCNIM